MVRRKICKKLDLKHPLGTDYRELADHFKIPNEDIRTISENSDPTDKLLERLWDNPKNTIAKLREVLACQYLASSRSLTMVFLGYYGTWWLCGDHRSKSSVRYMYRFFIQSSSMVLYCRKSYSSFSIKSKNIWASHENETNFWTSLNYVDSHNLPTDVQKAVCGSSSWLYSENLN